MHNPTQRDCIFHDWINPLDVRDDLGLFQRFRFLGHEPHEVIDEFNDDLQYLASTKGSLLLLVAGTVLVCISL